MQHAETRLIAYGTLRPGRSNHHIVSDIPGEWVRAGSKGTSTPAATTLAIARCATASGTTSRSWCPPPCLATGGASTASKARTTGGPYTGCCRIEAPLRQRVYRTLAVDLGRRRLRVAASIQQHSHPGATDQEVVANDQHRYGDRHHHPAFRYHAMASGATINCIAYTIGGCIRYCQ